MKEKRVRREQLYIDSWTQEAYDTAKDKLEQERKERVEDCLTEEDLAWLGQVHRSAEGCDLFKAASGYKIGGKDDLEKLFRLAFHGGIDIGEILRKTPGLQEYRERKGPFALR